MFGIDMDVMVVYGVNSEVLNVDSNIILNVLCIINCLVLIVKVINDIVGIE